MVPAAAGARVWPASRVIEAGFWPMILTGVPIRTLLALLATMR